MEAIMKEIRNKRETMKFYCLCAIAQWCGYARSGALTELTDKDLDRMACVDRCQE